MSSVDHILRSPPAQGSQLCGKARDNFEHGQPVTCAIGIRDLSLQQALTASAMAFSPSDTMNGTGFV